MSNSQPKFNPTEHQIQYLLMGYLRRKGYYVERLNSGKFSAGEGRSKRFIMGVTPGTPDLIAFKQYQGKLDCIKCDNPVGGLYTDLVFIEVKRPGNKPTALQKAKMEELEEYGARCIVATSVEDLETMGLA
jgi:hypothetical protein